MKPIESELIDQFLWHVKKDLIKSRANTKGKVVLNHTARALREILNGEAPDIALGISRPKEAHIQPMLRLAHELRKVGRTWKEVADICSIADQAALAKEYRKSKKHFDAIDKSQELFVDDLHSLLDLLGQDQQAS